MPHDTQPLARHDTRPLARRPARVPRVDGRGQSMVETALFAPILVFMLFFALDVGRALATTAVLSDVSREGARMLETQVAPASDPGPAIVQAMTTTIQADGHDLSGLRSITLYYAPSPADAAAGTSSSASDTYNFTNGRETSVTSGASPPGTSYDPTTGYNYAARQPGDYVGVTVRYHYSGISPLYAGGIDLSDTTNTQLDPTSAAAGASSAAAMPTPAAPPTAEP